MRSKASFCRGVGSVRTGTGTGVPAKRSSLRARVSALICTAATNAGIDPDRVKFKRDVRIRRADDPAVSPDQRKQLLDRVMAAITDPRKLNTKRERSYPRVVKRARRNSYRVKKPGQHGTRHHQTRLPGPDQGEHPHRGII
jgi:hypothetical protein